MTPSSLPPLPPAAICAVCSKPIQSGGFIQTARDEFIHLRCRNEDLRRSGIDPQDRARLTIERASGPIEQTRKPRATPPDPGANHRCPVCEEPAMLTDWRPQLDWLGIEDCPCGGFFVWTPLLDEGRLAQLTPEDREILKQHLRDLRAIGTQAWLTTRDRTVMGAFLIRSERPDRAR
jgi:hypothetical protein